MANIGDLAFRITADWAAFQKEAATQGAAAGDQSAAAFAKAHGRQVAALAGAAFLTAMTKSLIDLDTATKQYAADVGATAQEAEAAKKATLDLWRSNTQSMEEILGTMAKLRTDQGLTQDAAIALTETYLDFAKVAGETAPDAVLQFDDILDAWGLEAEDAQGIMDQLVASHQKYGGSITANASALSALAPRMRAMGMDVGDAIALLNLFAASGIDSGMAMRGLNQAIGQLRPGQNLNDLIARISAIEDPTMRAQEAARIFGARAGAALANALQPGITSLDQFGITADQAAGKTKTAADMIDSSLPKQFQLFMQNLGGQLLGLISEGGPILLFVAAIGQIATAFDLMKIKAVLAWAASAGPGALLAGGALIATLALLEAQMTGAADTNQNLTQGLQDLAAEERQVAADFADGTITVEERDRRLADLDARMRRLIETQGGQTQASEESVQAEGELENAAQRGAGAMDDLTAKTEEASGATTEFAGSATAASGAVTELTGTAATAAEAAQRHRLELLGEQGAALSAAQGMVALDSVTAGVTDKTNENVGALSVEVAWLDRVAYAAAVAARNLSALGTAQAAAQAGATRRLRQAGEAPGAGISGSLEHGYVTTVPQDLTFTPTPRVTGGGGGGGGRGGGGGGKSRADEAKKEAAAVLAAWKDEQRKELAAAKAAGDKYLAFVHDRNLKKIASDRDATMKAIEQSHKEALAKIEDRRKEARAAYEARYQSIYAPVRAFEAGVEARQNAIAMRDAQEAMDAANKELIEARKSGDKDRIAAAERGVRDANERMQDISDQATLASLRAQADAEAAALELDYENQQKELDELERQENEKYDLAKQAAQDLYDLQVAEENRRFEDQKIAYGLQYDALVEALNNAKTVTDTKLAEATGSFYTHGVAMGAALAAGLRSQKAEVEKAAKELADAVAAYTKTGSPARRGPFHAMPPEAMGRRIVEQFIEGMRGAWVAYMPNFAALMGHTLPALLPPAPFVAPQVPAAGTVLGQITRVVTGPGGGQTVYVTINNPREEPASTSLRRELQILAATGLLSEPRAWAEQRQAGRGLA